MCGIAVTFASQGARADGFILQAMTTALAHRGPDSEGAFLSGQVGLGVRRLSIFDLSSRANQPMADADRGAVLVFNGAIYNYVELRRELAARGHRFRSTGDTEVLLKAYLEWGPECLDRLNGMWAFVVYDPARETLFGARDRFGKKPLYRYMAKDCILLASEIKAILASGLYRGQLNWKAAAKFLLYDSLDSIPADPDETFYTDIVEVPPGSAFEITLDGRFRQWRFWQLPDGEEPVEDPPSRFAELFEDAVRLRLRGDVPVGIFLSGGLDSTSIAYTAARLRDGLAAESKAPLYAFAFQDDEFDESRYVRETVARTGVELVPFRPAPRTLWHSMERLLWFQDEPVHGLASVITFELSRLAAERGVKVILNGGGADEALAGYTSFFREYWYTLLRTSSPGLAWREISAYCATHGERRTRLFAKSVYQLARSQFARVPAYRRLAAWHRHRLLRRDPWFTGDLNRHLDLRHSDYDEPTLAWALKESVERVPLPLYLRIEDRNAMAHSIEARMPFLDYRLVSFAFTLPLQWKMRGPWSKYVLREAMRNRIPESIRRRPDKLGFPVPARAWFASALYEPMRDLVDSRSVRERGIYDVDRIRKDLELHRQGVVDVSKKAFNLAQFEMLFGARRVRPTHLGLPPHLTSPSGVTIPVPDGR